MPRRSLFFLAAFAILAVAMAGAVSFLLGYGHLTGWNALQIGSR